MPTNDKERDFEEVSTKLKFPGRFDPRLLNNTDDAGDGSPGLQKAIRNWVEYLLDSESVWRDHIRFVSNATELSQAASELTNGGTIYVLGDITSAVTISNDDIKVIGVGYPQLTDTLTVNANRFTLEGMYIYSVPQNSSKNFVDVTGDNCTIKKCRVYVTVTINSTINIDIFKVTGDEADVSDNDSIFHFAVAEPT